MQRFIIADQVVHKVITHPKKKKNSGRIFRETADPWSDVQKDQDDAEDDVHFHMRGGKTRL